MCAPVGDGAAAVILCSERFLKQQPARVRERAVKIRALTLSGGEAQRVKLASFLGKNKATGHILFIFDEPTTGLHFHDINKLLASFHALIEQGHSIIVIEHNTDVIKNADWVIDLGPEAGDGGGNLVFAGKPADLKKVKESYTGKFL